MIVYSKEKYLPTNSNVMTLEKDDRFFYVFRDTYDQCVILNNRYTQEQLLEFFPIRTNIKAYNFLAETLPEPINVLASFILLVKDELEIKEEDLYGAITVITSYMNLVRFISEDEKLRAGIGYTKSITKEYQLLWMKFFTMAIKWEQIEKLMQPIELQPQVEKEIYVPVQLVNAGNGMPLSGVSQTENTQSTVQEEPEEIPGMVALDDSYDPDEFKFIPPDLDTPSESEKGETESTSTEQVSDQGSVAGFNAEEDRQKALDILKQKKVAL